jgi:hypothetical protein
MWLSSCQKSNLIAFAIRIMLIRDCMAPRVGSAIRPASSPNVDDMRIFIQS